MDTPFEFEQDSANEAQLVYIRAVKVADLPKDVQKQAPGLDQLYAVHDTEGSRLALVSDRKTAAIAKEKSNLGDILSRDVG